MPTVPLLTIKEGILARRYTFRGYLLPRHFPRLWRFPDFFSCRVGDESNSWSPVSDKHSDEADSLPLSQPTPIRPDYASRVRWASRLIFSTRYQDI